MLNFLWLGLMLTALVTGFLNGKLPEVTTAAFQMAETAVTIAFGLIGIMAFWLGLMKIAEQSGLVKILARALRPISRILFPEIPPDHPVISSIMLNLSASWLGLSNAATPLGLKAMEELQSLNPHKDTASDAMITFLILNTAAITFIPATILGVRVSLGSTEPNAIIGTTIFAGLCATVVGILAARVLARLPVFSIRRERASDKKVTDRDNP
uniref:Spore maturation protein A n=1 Tax=Candidatus Kentrum sp. MB TaxID=2138164 RepID=A0A451BAY3_9GAMM|nr:MAG: spore maturation protein A [Candidatus Kentron sp. MB]VFK31323.1 MAG: spore maturation protein A [Candidatus Kentron sp. MB]VFK75437.1 MAG: spore maturation protein A [Candidatus Kentron sp. MB]